MSGPYLTGRISELLFELPIICEGAEETISSSKRKKAGSIAKLLAGRRKYKKQCVNRNRPEHDRLRSIKYS